jgi:hypothetical protein
MLKTVNINLSAYNSAINAEIEKLKIKAVYYNCDKCVFEVY